MRQAVRLLWIDCTAGSIVGLFLRCFHAWLSDIYALPKELVVFQGLCNLGYSVFSYSLASKGQRSYRWVVTLAAANMIWGAVCAVWLLWYWGVASFFGLAHLFLEAIFVGGLGYLEWMYRSSLITNGRIGKNDT